MLSASCSKKEKLVPPGPSHPKPQPSALEVVWQIRVDTTSFGSQAREPLIWEDNLIWNNAAFGQGFEIMLTDGETGAEIWRWKDFIQYPELPYNNFHFVKGDRYCFNNIQETYIIDIQTGITLWQEYNPNSGAYISLAGDHLYGKLNNKDFRPDQCRLRRLRLDSPQWEEVLRLNASENMGYSPAIFGPGLWLSPSGDSILVYQNRSWNFMTQDGKIDFHAFNLSTDTYHFQLMDVEPSGNSNVHAPFIDGDRAYLMGQKNLHCVDLVSGQILWQKGFPGSGHHLMLSNLVIDGDKLILKPDDDRIYAFNKYSGTLLWSQENAGASASHIYLDRGAVYYTSDADGKLYGVRTADGNIFIAAESPNSTPDRFPGASFQGGLAINNKLNLIYLHDHYYMMAIKIPGSP